MKFLSTKIKPETAVAGGLILAAGALLIFAYRTHASKAAIAAAAQSAQNQQYQADQSQLAGLSTSGGLGAYGGALGSYYNGGSGSGAPAVTGAQSSGGAPLTGSGSSGGGAAGILAPTATQAFIAAIGALPGGQAGNLAQGAPAGSSLASQPISNAGQVDASQVAAAMATNGFDPSLSGLEQSLGSGWLNDPAPTSTPTAAASTSAPASTTTSAPASTAPQTLNANMTSQQMLADIQNLPAGQTWLNLLPPL